MYLVIPHLVLTAGCGMWLYQFLIIAYLFTLLTNQPICLGWLTYQHTSLLIYLGWLTNQDTNLSIRVD